MQVTHYRPPEMSDQSTQFVSFYSYKGGVGRSTVLANLAYWQAMQGRKVLIIDLDLEAPGQHRSGLFKGNPVADSPIKGGFIDLCEAWQQHSTNASDEVYEWDLRDYMLRSALLDTLPGTDKGEIFLMPAGKKLDTGYAEKLNRLDWHKFFSSTGRKGYQLLTTLKLYCEIEEFDNVLIDSRTGLSDPYYMATSWLSDTVVCFSLLNQQSIEGCRYTMELIMTEDFRNKYGEKRVLPVITLVPPTRNFKANERIKAILTNEWPEINEGFVTEFRYDEALAVEEQILALKDEFEKSDFGKSLQALNSALKESASYLMSREQARKNFSEPLENPFPNLRVEYWSPKEIASHYSAIYPRIEAQLTNFQPIIVYGSRGTGKTTMARYFDYQTQLIIFKQNNQRLPKPEELPYLGLWIRQDSDFLKAFNVPDKDKQNDYSALFGLFFDMVVLRKSLYAMQDSGGLAGWVKSTAELFRVLCREIGAPIAKQCDLEAFLGHLETRLYEIRAYINNPHRYKIPILFQSNTLMKLLAEQLKQRRTFHFVVFVDEVENYASHQQQMLNTRVKHVKESDVVTYKLLARNDGIKTPLTDSDEQELEITHDYRACFLDEEIKFDEFRKRAEILVDQYITSSPQFQHIGKVQKFLEYFTPEEEARKICEKRSNKQLIKHLYEQHRLEANHPLVRWMQKEPNLLRQAVATVIVNQGKNADDVAKSMHDNTSTAQDWYHNYSRGALYWLCTLHGKTKTYSGFNDIAGIAGENIRVVVDLFYAIFEEWITQEERELPFSYELQNRCIQDLSRTYFKKLDRFRPTEHRLNRLVERLGNLFAAIHKSPRQGEPEINHFSANGDLDDETVKHLKICRQENLLRWLPSNKQKSSSDYLPDAFQINPCFAPNFGISWRRKKKLTLTPDDVHKLCLGTDDEWKKIHSRIERQYHRGRNGDKSQESLLL